MVPSSRETTPQTDSEPRAAAMRRAQAKIEFFRHLLVYAIVIGCLCAINLTTSPQYLWFVWPAAGWGIGILAHAANLFVFSDELTERMVERELRRSQRH